MALGGAALLPLASVLDQLLEEINFQRTKEMRQLMKDGQLALRYSYSCLLHHYIYYNIVLLFVTIICHNYSTDFTLYAGHNLD